jgi:hypothetical protein
MKKRIEPIQRKEEVGLDPKGVRIFGGQVLRCTANGSTYPNGTSRPEHDQCWWTVASSKYPGEFEVIIMVNMPKSHFSLRCPECRGEVELIYFNDNEPVRLKQFSF